MLQKSYVYLKKIINKEVSFTKVLNRNINNDVTNENDVKLLKDTIKSTINKYYIVRYEVLNSLNDIKLNEDEINILILLVSMNEYVKGINIEEALAYYNQDEAYFKENIENYSLSLEIVEKTLNYIKNNPLDIKHRFDDIPFKKLALKFSYPEWVVKMHLKHFGFKNTIKSLSTLRHSIPLVINYNRNLITPNELNSDDFKKCMLTSTSYAYVSKDKILDNKLFKEKKIFVEDEATQFFSNKLDPRQGENILLIEDSKGLMPLDVCLKVGKYASVVSASSSLENLNFVRKLANSFALKSLHAIETTMKLLITHVEPNHFDKVLVIPPSSSLGLVRKNPDILLTLKRTELDELIENQKYTLQEASTFVNVDGFLLYGVYTMNKKEGELIVKDFLTNNENFALIEERQVFPYESMNDGFYYALLKRGN